MTTKELRELLLEAGTPWSCDPGDDAIEGENGGAVCFLAHHASMHTILKRGEDWNGSHAALIVAAVNALPALLDVAEAAIAYRKMSGHCEYRELATYAIALDDALTRLKDIPHAR